MLSIIASNAMPIATAIVAIVLSYAYIKFKTLQNEKDIGRVEGKFDSEIEELKAKFEHDKDRIYEEIDDVKKSYMDTNSQILLKLDELAKDVKDISVDLAFFKGQQSKAC